MKRFLAKQKDTWGATAQKAVTEGPGGSSSIPDGQYVMQLTGSELVEAKKSGKAMLKNAYTVVEGDLTGSIKYDYVQLEGTRGTEPLAWFLQHFGYDPLELNIEYLPDYLESMVKAGHVCKVGLSTTGDYQNLRFQELLHDYDPEDNTEIESTYHATEGDTEQVDEAPDAVEPEASEDDLRVGMKVSFELKGKATTGIVKAINDEDADIQVGLTKHKVSFDKMEIVDEGKDS